MIDSQCGFCGGFDKIGTCNYCGQPACESCVRNHGPYCEDIQKRKKRGEGPTVANMGRPRHRAGHETPAEPRRNAMPAALGAPYDLSAVPDATGDPYADFAKLIAFDAPALAPESNVDTGLQGVKDLLTEQDFPENK